MKKNQMVVEEEADEEETLTLLNAHKVQITKT